MTRLDGLTPEQVREYRRHYTRGWASGLSGASLDAADRRGDTRIEAWLDGRYDAGAGRAKWHRAYCPDHTGSGEGHGCGEA
jgi:hypothetical protein